MTNEEMKKLAEWTVETAVSNGADTAEVAVTGSKEFSVTVRNGGIENLNESVSSRIGITVSTEKRKASITSTDLSEDSIRQLIIEGVELSRVMDSDEFFGLPEADQLGIHEADLGIYDPLTARMPADRMIALVNDLERTACALDGRIISDGASASCGEQAVAFANSLGFIGAYRKSYNSIVISCAVQDTPTKGENTGKKQSSYWYSASPSFSGLEDVGEIASKAVERTIRKLGAVKPETCELPVIFDPVTARSFLGWMASAVNGGNIYRKSSFLVDMIDGKVGSDLLTVVDDPLLAGKLGSRPFDGEGVKPRRNVVFENGTLKSYLMSSYQARKLGSVTTGNAGGFSNLYLVPGDTTEADIIASVDKGLYLTSISGPGANWSNGDFSQGGQGIWINNGELTYPVTEFTIAGTFPRMLSGISMVGDILDWRSSLASPPFKIDGMTISGT